MMRPTLVRGGEGMPPMPPAGARSADTTLLAANENAWGASPAALEHLRQSAEAVNRYPDPSYGSLRTRLAEAVGADASEIIVGAGSEQLIVNAVAAYCGRGHELVVDALGFALHAIAGTMAGATPIRAASQGWAADVTTVLAAQSASTRLVAIATPNNPTGTALSEAELLRLAHGIADDVVLLLDLAYAEFADPEMVARAHALASTRPNVIVLRTFSKAHGLAGLRVGWAHGNETLLAPLRRLCPPFPVTALAEATCIAALDDEAWLSRTRAAMERERGRLIAGLRALAIEPVESHTNFVMADFGSPQRTRRALALLREANIVVRPLEMYGLAQQLRITVGRSDETSRLLETLHALGTNTG